MHCNTFLVAVASLTFANAIKVPDGTPDGVYAVSFDANGVDIHTPLNMTSSTTNPASRHKRSKDDRAFSRRGDLDNWDADGKIHCWGDMSLDPTDTDTANTMVDAQCNAGTKATEDADHIYSKSGTVVAFFCRYWQSATTACDTSLRAKYDADITMMCGKYMGGQQTYWDDHLKSYYVFGYATSDTEFCTPQLA